MLYPEPRLGSIQATGPLTDIDRSPTKTKLRGAEGRGGEPKPRPRSLFTPGGYARRKLPTRKIPTVNDCIIYFASKRDAETGVSQGKSSDFDVFCPIYMSRILRFHGH